MRAGHRIIFKLRPWSSHGYLPPSAASFSLEPCFSVSRSPAVRISLCSAVRVAVPCACATPCAPRLSPSQLRLWSFSMSAAVGSPHPAVVSNLILTPLFLVLNTGFAVGLCYNIGPRHRPTRSRRREDYSASLGLDGLLVYMGGGLVRVEFDRSIK